MIVLCWPERQNLEGFGNVVHSDEQREEMKRAREYAVRYNAVIIRGCPLSK